ncbi:excalibur calcium-binding domain-containing protein [Mycobacterium colombiense]|uniref:excalibur calcium-binding domain-containing protein n=1 Tax=Mycobacterium colombiense TaxID=339268 RepID=UPI003556AD16
MRGLRQPTRRLTLSEQARDRLARIAAWLLVVIIVVCVVIVIVAVAKRGVSLPRPQRSPYPTTHFTTTPSRPRVFYKNCDEAHKDGRWNIPADDPAYRPALDKDHDGIACASRARR